MAIAVLNLVAMRKYQTRIVNASVGKNTIVSLPTGAGKTLIAAELIMRTGAESWAPGKLCARTLMLVPTRPLVEQQARAVMDWHRQHGIASKVEQYHGDMRLPACFDVLVSTPAAFQVAQIKDSAEGGALAWSTWDLLVIDEVHHADPNKDHPYRKLTTSLTTAANRKPDSPMPRVLGLTASLTYATTNIGESINRLCSKLGIVQIENASDEELSRDGYQATRSPAQTVPQVAMPAGLVPVTDRKPHLMMSMFHQRIKSGQATPFAMQLCEAIQSLERRACGVDTNFKSPLERKPISQWESYAHNYAKHATREAKPVISELVHWYGALKLLVISWEGDECLAVEFLRMTTVAQNYSTEATEFFAHMPQRGPRLEQLHRALLQVHGEIDEFRGIVFVEQRVTTYILQHFIKKTSLNNLFRPEVVYSTSSSATPSLSLSPSAQAAAMRRFASGESNLLICTSTVEEGMDVPESNCVICFDITPHAVSLVQRRGRGRQAGSKFIVLAERADRTIRDLEQIEQDQLQVCAEFEVPELTHEQRQTQLAQEHAKQISRERTAGEKLRRQVKKVGTVTIQNAVGILNTVCKQTKVDFTEFVSGNEVVLRYESIIRSCEGRGQGSRKNAKRNAAIALVLVLCEQIGNAQ
jgi:ERCC4-related helicase